MIMQNEDINQKIAFVQGAYKGFLRSKKWLRL